MRAGAGDRQRSEEADACLPDVTLGPADAGAGADQQIERGSDRDRQLDSACEARVQLGTRGPLCREREREIVRRESRSVNREDVAARIVAPNGDVLGNRLDC